MSAFDNSQDAHDCLKYLVNTRLQYSENFREFHNPRLIFLPTPRRLLDLVFTGINWLLETFDASSEKPKTAV